MAKKVMSNEQFQQWMEQQAAERALRHQAKAYAAALIQVHCIRPYGIDLVCWLADASCQNNEAAVARWVWGELRASADDAPSLDDLSTRLHRRLEDVCQSYAL